MLKISLRRKYLSFMVGVVVFLGLVWFTLPQHTLALPPEPAIDNVVETECTNGTSAGFPCDKINLLAQLSVTDLGAGTDIDLANLWGWTDPETNKEYVIVGLTNGTAFVDISNPETPIYLGTLPTHNTVSRYRDMKVYQNHAFIIADTPLDTAAPGEGDTPDGMQIFDLTQLGLVDTPPMTFTETSHYDVFDAGHNIFINEETGFAYIVRVTLPTDIPETCGGAVHMVNLVDPRNPRFAGCYTDGGLASDTMCVAYHGPDADYDGQEICLVASDDNILIADVTDKNAPATVADLAYPDVTRAHLAWFTKNKRYFVSSDMNDEMMLGYNTRIMLWDALDLDNPKLLGIYEGPTPASDHNVWVRGGFAYIGNFRAGLRILDIRQMGHSTPLSATVSQAAYFDIIPEDDNTGHMAGAWAIYPYFDSGVIAFTEKFKQLSGEGAKEPGRLFLVRPNLPGDEVTLSGPFTGMANTDYSFTATINPLTGSMGTGTFGTFMPPLTYTWQATDHAEVMMMTTTYSHTMSYQWTSGGTKTMVVTVEDASGKQATDFFTIEISQPQHMLYLPIVLKSFEPLPD